ncbi:MAG: hypothetical protein BAJALOKI1v1_1630013 [Promethearchaeota archaeon]|nr:MAG: hypothetical protein BAJALOKI1v1_1630013 [Candidatus Lokiarchaeota archaeon]
MAMNCNYWNLDILKKSAPETESESSPESIKPILEKTPSQE